MRRRKRFERAELESVYQILFATYGPQHWWPAQSAFEVIVGAMLIQRTAWSNAALALERLRERACLDPLRLAALTPDELAALIRPAGFYRQKSARILAFTRWLNAAGGCDALAELDDAALREALLRHSGIGAETADAICLYAFGRANFVIDAYLRRVFERLGLIDGDEPADALRAAIERALGPDVTRYNEYHALIVEHARQHCRARPRCAPCAFHPRCPTAAASRAVSH